MTAIRRCATPAVLLIWAATWAAGARGDALIAAWLTVTAGCVIAREMHRHGI